MEGVAQEAISLAGHLGLSKLTLVFDDNSTTIDGSTDLSTSERHLDRFAAAGWETMEIDGHDGAEIRSAFDQLGLQERSARFLSRRARASGSAPPRKEGSNTAHGAPRSGGACGSAQSARVDRRPLRGSPEIGAACEAGARGDEQRREWEVRLVNHDRGKEFMGAETGALPETLHDAIRDEIRTWSPRP